MQGILLIMTDDRHDGAPRQMFSDARSSQRFLRVSSHPAQHLVTLSVWGDSECLATFRLPTAEVPELVAVLVQGLAAGETLTEEALPQTGALGLDEPAATVPAQQSQRPVAGTHPATAASAPSDTRRAALRAVDLLIARAADVIRARLDRLGPPGPGQ